MKKKIKENVFITILLKDICDFCYLYFGTLLIIYLWAEFGGSNWVWGPEPAPRHFWRRVMSNQVSGERKDPTLPTPPRRALAMHRTSQHQQPASPRFLPVIVIPSYLYSQDKSHMHQRPKGSDKFQLTYNKQLKCKGGWFSASAHKATEGLTSPRAMRIQCIPTTEAKQLVLSSVPARSRTSY